MDAFFASYYARRPVNATFIGVHDRDHELPDFSDHGAGDTLSEMRRFLDDIRSVRGEVGRDRYGAPSGAEDLDLRLAEGFLRTQVWEFESRHFHRGNPSLYVGEAIFGVMSLFLTEFAPLIERVAAATERMEAVPRLMAQGIENVRRAPDAWARRAIRECRGALAFLEEGIEYLPMASNDAGFREAAGRAAEAFRKFQRYLDTELGPAPLESVSCGEEALDLYLREGHFLEQSAADLAAYAESEVAEAGARLDAALSDRPEALSGLADLYPPVERYYARYQEVWDAVRARAEQTGLLTWPDFPIRYVPRPQWAREAAPDLYFLFYRSPAAFNRPEVHHYLVTPIEEDMPADRQTEFLRANNDSVIKLNHVIHHGSIGHHVQNWHAFRSPSRVGRIAAVDCASRIAMFCGGTMAEGWACYATDLMSEFGALTELEQLAELQSRKRMCARTVVDVRLHQGRFDLQEAAAYYRANAGMSEAAAESEAVKNSMFPGAAVMYLVGTDAIHALRKELARRDGPAFSLRSFHDEFLSYGSVPVSLIAEEMLKARGEK